MVSVNGRWRRPRGPPPNVNIDCPPNICPQDDPWWFAKHVNPNNDNGDTVQLNKNTKIPNELIMIGIPIFIIMACIFTMCNIYFCCNKNRNKYDIKNKSKQGEKIEYSTDETDEEDKV